VQIKEQVDNGEIKIETKQQKEALETINAQVAHLKRVLKQQSKNDIIRLAIDHMVAYAELQQAAKTILDENNELKAKLEDNKVEIKKEKN
jgi:transcriptional regulator CtsR